jgi:hypothetical protein
MGLLKLAIDRQNKSMVAYNGSVASIPPFFQSNTPTLQVFVVDPVNALGTYSLVDLNGFGLRVSVGDTPTGSAGGPTPLTLQDTFAWDPVSKSFSADLNLAVVAMDTFLGAAASKSAYFEVNLTKDGKRDTLLQQTFTIKAVVDELTGIAPTPTDQFLTKAETLAMFQRMVGPLGQRLVLRSANGLYGLELGVGDDGSLITNIIPNP